MTWEVGNGNLTVVCLIEYWCMGFNLNSKWNWVLLLSNGRRRTASAAYDGECGRLDPGLWV